MPNAERRQAFAGLRTTSLGTLLSRVLGMVRDMATAALLGLSGSAVMDAFVIAFRIPNLFRRLFGEGALTASYLPVVSAQLERSRQAGWQLASVMLTLLTAGLTAVIILGELLCGVLSWLYGDVAQIRLVAGLAALMLPYAIFICIAAQLSATLHALGHFGAPAATPTVLNVCWIVAALFVAPAFAPDKAAQAYVIAASVSIAGLFQAAVQWPFLRALGFRYEFNWSAAREPALGVFRGMVPMVLGLAVTQINTLLDSLIAWLLSTDLPGGETIGWLGDTVTYPMQQGAAAAIYYGERLYQFPAGVVGITVATVIFPLLSRHAARGHYDRLRDDLSMGLRLVLFLGLPASAGLVLLARPIAAVLFERGEFTATDTLRTARMIAWYGAGVWAYCALPVVLRGFYAVGERTTPVKVGITIVTLNFALNLALIWPLAERGLAASTALTAALQAAVLVTIFSRSFGPVDWRALRFTTLRTLIATGAMWGVGAWALERLPVGADLTSQLVRVGIPLAAGMLAFFATARLLGSNELSLLRGEGEEKNGSQTTARRRKH